MKRLIVTLILALLGLGCKGGGGGAESVTFPGEGPEAVSISLKGGSGFECFLFGEELLCRGFPANNDLLTLMGAGSVFVPVAAGPLSDLRTWDDTVCVSGPVSLRPYARDPGTGLYCWGEATLNPTYSVFPIVYGGPTYSHVVNGTPEVSYSTAPNWGGDMTATYFATQTATAQPIPSDGVSLTTEETLSCLYNQTEGTLACPSFTVEDL